VWNGELRDLEVYANVNHDSFGGFKLSTEGLGPAINVSFHHNLAYNNLVHGIHVTDFGENKSDYLKQGIHIYNNTLHNNGRFGIFLQGQKVRDVAIRNNICTANGRFQIGAVGQDFEALNIHVDHNLVDEFFNTWRWADAIRGEALVVGDPMYVDAEAGDFRLRPGSPAIDVGNPDPVYNDPDGTRSDIGAFPRSQR
jgi:hypothetical protein